MSLPNVPSSSPAATSPFSVNPCSVNSTADSTTESFVDRRSTQAADSDQSRERRQFGSSHAGLSDDGRELALAIDQYKLQRHRRYLTCDEMLHVLASLGYSKQP